MVSSLRQSDETRKKITFKTHEKRQASGNQVMLLSFMLLIIVVKLYTIKKKHRTKTHDRITNEHTSIMGCDRDKHDIDLNHDQSRS
jgi:hypothetical protein